MIPAARSLTVWLCTSKKCSAGLLTGCSAGFPARARTPHSTISSGQRPSVSAMVALIVLLIPVCGFGPDAAESAGRTIDTDIIVTSAPVYEPLAALRGQERFPKGAQLLLVRQGNAEPLVAGLRLARTPMFPSMPSGSCSRASRRRAIPGRYGIDA